jgi:hypothetical protein
VEDWILKKLLVAVLLIPSICFGGSFEDHVLNHYTSVVKKIEACGYNGPIAKELAQYAVIRQGLEDGLNRPHTYSIPGISSGGWNEDILKGVIKVLKPEITLGHCRDSEGVRLFILQGDEACRVSATTIACLYGYYLVKFNKSFSDKQHQIWGRSITYSYLLSCKPDLVEYKEEYDALKNDRIKIIQRCNRMYGPKSDQIERKVNELQFLFEER